jgi:lipopolysaccharide/colanic/teichoic acid biosynthesis glycosyltransferase
MPDKDVSSKPVPGEAAPDKRTSGALVPGDGVIKQGKGIPRAIESGIALAGFVVVSPLLLAAGAAIAMTSPGPVIFRQQRVGRNGRNFTLYKLRTMGVMNTGPQVTAGNDNRITPVGKILRKTKLDEFPELLNIIKGDMSLVGPRPEVPRYVERDSPAWKSALQARPGLTDPVTLRLRNEEALMSQIQGDAEEFYRTVLQPVKLRGYNEYLENRSWHSDITVLIKTVLAVLLPLKAPPPTVEELMQQAEEASTHF